MKRLLLAFAHPNDESFAASGTIARYVQAGWQVDLVVACHTPAREKSEYDEKGEVVVHEPKLDAACQTLGITSVKVLGFTEGNLAAQNPGEIEDKLYRIIEEKLPHVVITFDPTGISNHPDHSKMCLSATFSFQKYVTWLVDTKKKPQIYGKHEEEWYKQLEKIVNAIEPPKLYYVCMPESMITFAKKSGAVPQESHGKLLLGTPDKKITTVINTSKYKDIKAKAVLCYKDVDEEKAPAEATDVPVLEQEYFVQRYEGLTEIFMGKNDVVSDEL